MARARNIKPGFFKNDELAQCEYGARLMFAGLWCLADREGRLEDRPLRIKGELFPYDNCDVESWLKQLSDRSFIARYEVAGRKYIQIHTFQKHQNPHCKEPASTIPAQCEHGARTEVAGLIPDSLLLIPDSPILIPDSLNQPVPGKTGESKPAKGRESYSQEFELFWQTYPPIRKTKKAPAWAAWKKAIRSTDPQTIIAAVEEFAKSPMGTGEFCPGPEPWLNNSRWEDDRRAWQQRPSNAASVIDPRGNFAAAKAYLESFPETEGGAK